MRIVDLSAPIAPSAEGTHAFLRTDIDYADYAAGAAQILALVGRHAEERLAASNCNRPNKCSVRENHYNSPLRSTLVDQHYSCNEYSLVETEL